MLIYLIGCQYLLLNFIEYDADKSRICMKKIVDLTFIINEKITEQPQYFPSYFSDRFDTI